MPTIHDVAARARVSIKTVSRVLNNEPHVREHLRERVLAAVAELGYSPNQAARRMAGRRSYLIAFPYSNPNPHFITAVQSGAAMQCRERGYHLVVEYVSLEDQAIAAVLERLVRTLAPDAMFAVPPLCDREDFLAAMAALPTPLVRIAGGREASGPNLQLDDRKAARNIIRHLIELGHRRIAMIRPHPDHLTAAQRFDGYVDAMKEAGLEIDPSCIVQGYFTFESGRAAARELLTLDSRPTAVFAANDIMALGAMSVAHEMNIPLPEGLSIAGFDDIPATTTCWPSLTTVRQPLHNLGVAVIEVALGRPIPAEISLEHELVIRDSTCPPSG